MAAIPLDRDWYWGFMDNCHVSGVKLYQPNPTYLAWLEKASTFPMRSIFVEQEQVIALGKSTARLLEKIAQDKVQKPASVSPQPTPTEENDIPKAVKVLNSDNKEPDLLVAQEAEWDQLTRACKAAETLARLSELAIPDHVLSVDILCCIFRSAACSSSAEAKMLSLVSREVQTWVDPFVFRYLAPKDNYTAFYKTLKTKVSPRLVRAKDVHFKGLTVVHLVLEDSEDSRLARLIKTVPALRSLSSIADILRYYRYSKSIQMMLNHYLDIGIGLHCGSSRSLNTFFFILILRDSATRSQRRRLKESITFCSLIGFTPSFPMHSMFSFGSFPPLSSTRVDILPPPLA
ncbi:hypothetical protein DL96DRAFT_1675888 [Flagelloscypha sp. PMI_526]|nr:hypothetical protein DL96DRAFT_1675888 [Flagelloscypha sp. PMI_526]